MKNVILILIIAGLFVLSGCNGEPAEYNMIPTGKINRNITAIQVAIVNFYIFSDGKDSIAIDAGGFDSAIITNQLAKAGVDAGKVEMVFLTHSDFDHTGGLGIFSNARIYLSAAEEVLITGRKARSGWTYHNERISFPYKLLKDGDTISIGSVRVKMILTPGHTTGSACYLVNGRYLFTGDTLSLRDGKVEPFFKKFNMDTNQQDQSIRKLASLPDLSNIAIICTGHSGIATNVAKAFSNWH